MIFNDDGTYDSMSEVEVEALDQVAMHWHVNKYEDDQVMRSIPRSSPCTLRLLSKPQEDI